MLVATGAWAFAASVETPHYDVWLRWTVVALTVLAVALLSWSRLVPALRTPTAVVIAAAVFAAPAVWTASVLTQRSDPMGSVAAAAGPPQSMFGRHGMGDVTSAEIEKGLRAFSRGPDPAVERFLAAHQGSKGYAAVVDGSMSAAPYLAKGVRVLPMGGFTGDAPAPTTAGLAALVRDGSVRYAVLGGMRMSAKKRDNGRDAWVKTHCQTVAGLGGSVSKGSTGKGSTGNPMSGVVYDCGAFVR